MTRGERTRLGIGKARSRGVDWGRHGAVLAALNRSEADEFALSLRPLLIDVMKFGWLGPRRLARMLNELGIPAKKGGKWYPATADRLFKRLGPAFREEQRKRIVAALDKSLGGQSK